MSSYYGSRDGYCVHGVYVGGCGIDWMCGDCEMGNFTPVTITEYRSILSGLDKDGKPFSHADRWTTQKEAEHFAKAWLEIFRDIRESQLIEARTEPRQRTVWTNGKGD